jgi:hypothetical protein
MHAMEQQDTFDLGQATEVLRATPGALRGLLADLPQQWLHFQEDPEAWSPYTVLIHFIHNERTNWIPRARVILSADDARQFPPFRQLPESHEPDGQPVGDLLTEFAELREANLATLGEFNLKTSDLDRQGVHPVLGMVNLRQLLATWVVHDMNHIHQITKSLAKRYLIAVGPWRKNLAILDISA